MPQRKETLGRQSWLTVATDFFTVAAVETEVISQNPPPRPAADLFHSFMSQYPKIDQIYSQINERCS
jgi:hypothetical protein